jgi:hypothetical protein
MVLRSEAMALGETRPSVEALVVRELMREGAGALDEEAARRIAGAVAAAIEANNYAIETKLTQQLQTSGLHV